MAKPRSIREDFIKMKAKSLFKEFRISQPPVDLDLITNKLGIEVHYHDMSDINCSLSIKNQDRYIIVILISGNYGRDRWSLAHELGHIVLNHYELYEIDTIYVDKLNEYERYLLDREADLFAEELLIPSDWVKYNQSFDTDDLKEIFKVSREAMVVRLSKLRAVR